ncbi:DUF6703 family protein [Actinomadura flavalba]|uniref:DUF6703 family protein n=1 Tax=Actinomadura flavalba TaxID=1120938 RepID=UPI0003638640|nr:DUF6703 family protein [Actinomadura flavalba]
METREPPGPGTEGFRAAVERRSAPAVVLLHRRRTLFLIAVLVLLCVGLFVANWLGVAALLVLIAITTWLAYLNWPRLTTGARIGRVLAFAVLAAFAVSHALGRF